MRSRLFESLIVALVLSTAGLVGAADESWRTKVDPWVLETGRSQTTEFLVYLDQQADLSEAATLPTKAEKGAFVHHALSELAERTQAPVLAALADRAVEHRSYWIANMIWVRGGIDTVQAMAERSEVARIYANPAVTVDTIPANPGLDDPPIDGVEWNIALVNADDVWAAGVTGSGAVVAGQDTGYLWDHPALVNQYRGGPGGNHAYNWHDAVHSGGGSCGPDSPEPCDDHGHGTHTMGTIVGDDGLGNQVGMAPTAKWIGCRNMDQGTGTPTTYAECYQFFIAPTDLAGSNPDPAMAPDVINNSWACPPSEGCTDPNILLTVVQNVRAAGIVTVHSAGNSGSSCSTVSTPSAIYGESFSVGATSSSDGIASFSSRGPVTVDGSNRLKPDISAPGVDIRSSTRDGGYQGGWDGTSMAGPHVAGLVALLVSESPSLAGDVDTIEEIIEATAVPLTSSQSCGGIGAGEVPNNVFGWGRIDALAAHEYPPTFRVVEDRGPAAVCAPGEATFDIIIRQIKDFFEPVTLSTVGLPAGATASFTVNPVSPPGTSGLTIGNTGAVAPGSHPFDIVGTSSPSGVVHQAPAMVDIFDAIPGITTLLTPIDEATDVSLLPTLAWSSVSQADLYELQVSDDGFFGTIVASAMVEGTSHQLQTPLLPDWVYYWRARTVNPCGEGQWSDPFVFFTRSIPSILLVDDDDNDPDVQTTYTAALDAMGLQYDIWDTGNSDTEPSMAELGPYSTVIWFTGVEFGGAAGPGAAGEASLAGWLENAPTCLLISAQDYYFDRGLTTFMQSHLGLASASSDTSQTTVTGVGSVFDGQGPFSLSYPFSNYSDTFTADAAGETAFSGNQGDAAVNKRTGFSLATFWGFPWEALPTAGDREATLQAFLDACLDGSNGVFRDGFESGDLSAWVQVNP